MSRRCLLFERCYTQSRQRKIVRSSRGFPGLQSVLHSKRTEETHVILIATTVHVDSRDYGMALFRKFFD
jgi:hypothetical protein